jgi:hypothetical protein
MVALAYLVTLAVACGESPPSITFTGRLVSGESTDGQVCALVETPTGKRWSAFWPEDYTESNAPVELRDPDGLLVASEGDDLLMTGPDPELGSGDSSCLGFPPMIVDTVRLSP